jgi:amino-acid N-acetyltransferase
MTDVPAIHRLVTHHAELGRMLFRSHADLYEHLRDFFVFDDNGQVVGCCAVEIVWRDLAEIKSLAVDESRRGQGIGKALAAAARAEAHRLALARLFALTREPAFFERLGYRSVPREKLPHKVWTDCVHCPVQDHCDEVAMVLDIPTETSRDRASSAAASSTAATD